MGKLAEYLQREFRRHPLDGWQCHAEVPLLSPDFDNFFGYEPRVGILMERLDGSRRLWIEFEISRADPVANHAKFATAHLFQPQSTRDTFVSMISSHVDRGRRNLAANTILLMRHVGMNAFQTVLLPQLMPDRIKRLNHLSIADLEKEDVDVHSEMQKVLDISETVAHTSDKCIHFSSDLLEVIFNLRKWNEEIQIERNKKLWGKRTVTYFVFDPLSETFAPSKFCAYIAISASRLLSSNTAMSIELYITLDGTDSRFDGRRARLHLTKGLGMISKKLPDSISLFIAFDNWLSQHTETITVHPNGAIILIPPEWFITVKRKPPSPHYP